MKLFCSVFAFLLLSSLSLKAQQHPGFKASMNFGSINSDQIDFTNNLGYGFGFATMWVINERLDFFIDLTYEQFNHTVMGREALDYNSPLSEIYNEYSFGINGVYGSLLPNYYIIPEHLSVNAGIIYGVSWLKDEMNINSVYLGNGDYLEDNISYEELGSAMSGFDFFLAFGLSGGTENLKANLRYNLGMKNYLKEYYPDQKLKRNFFQLSITYYFLNVELVRG